ncbi:hypothetical protein YC2023_013287 [Brassica napus]
MGRRKIDMGKSKTQTQSKLGLFKKASEFVTLWPVQRRGWYCCLFSWKGALLLRKPNFDLIAERFKKESSQN